MFDQELDFISSLHTKMLNNEEITEDEKSSYSIIMSVLKDNNISVPFYLEM